jgi:hypothetical protein
MAIERKYISAINSNSSVQSSKMESDIDQKKKINLFHVRVIVKHTKLDTLFDNVSQVNIIFEAIVKNLVLKTKPHKNPYHLGWVCDDVFRDITPHIGRIIYFHVIKVNINKEE